MKYLLTLVAALGLSWGALAQEMPPQPQQPPQTFSDMATSMMEKSRTSLCPSAQDTELCKQKFDALISEARGVGVGQAVAAQRAAEGDKVYPEKMQKHLQEEIGDLQRRYIELMESYSLRDI